MTTHEQPQSTLGSRIERAREDHNMSRDTLAAMVGKTAKTIAHYEKGTNSPTCETVNGIAKALTIDPQYLFCGTNDKGEPSSSDTTSETTSVDKLEAHLKQLAELARSGLGGQEDKVTAHVEVIQAETGNWALEDILVLAEKSGLHDIDAITEPIEKLKEMVYWPAGGTTDDDIKQLTHAIIVEVVERLIDQVLFGIDLYAVDMAKLEVFAEQHNIAPNRLIAFGWRGHTELVPQIRVTARELVLTGEVLWVQE